MTITEAAEGGKPFPEDMSPHRDNKHPEEERATRSNLVSKHPEEEGQTIKPTTNAATNRPRRVKTNREAVTVIANRKNPKALRASISHQHHRHQRRQRCHLHIEE